MIVIFTGSLNEDNKKLKHANTDKIDKGICFFISDILKKLPR